MSRIRLIIMLAGWCLACPCSAGRAPAVNTAAAATAGATATSSYRPEDFADADAAYDALIEAMDGCQGPAEKLALNEAFLTAFPASDHTVSRVEALVAYRGSQLGDFPGAIAWVEDFRARLAAPERQVDPALLESLDHKLIDLYGTADMVDAMCRLARDLHDAGKLRFNDYLKVIRHANRLERWTLADEWCQLARRVVNAAGVRREYPGFEFGTQELQVNVDNWRGMLLCYQSRALARLGAPRAALNDFAEADSLLWKTYLGVPDVPLDLFWGETLAAAGRPEQALDRLTRPALILGDEDALVLYWRLYAEVHGGEAGFAEHARRQRERLARTLDDFTLPDYDGRRHDWCDIRGRATLLSFWYPTCIGCRVELPQLEALWERYRDQGLRVVAIDARADTERAHRFIVQQNLSFLTLENTPDDDVVGCRFNVDSFPQSWLIDDEGRIVRVHRNWQDGDAQELERQIRELLDL